METTTKNNGQVKVAGTVKADKKAPQFVTGNPVNKVSAAAEKKPEEKTGEEKGVLLAEKNVSSQMPIVAEPTKGEIKEQLATNKPLMSLEETLLLIKELAEKTALRNVYICSLLLTGS
jgi:hypothetical protein